MRSSATRLITILSVVAGAFSTVMAHGATSDGERPRIAECRIGLGGHVKTGFWTPIRIALSGDIVRRSLTLEATTVDSDGVRVSSAVELPTGGNSVEGIRSVTVYTKVGRMGAPIRVSLRADDNSILDHVDLVPTASLERADGYTPMEATSELVVHLGASKVGLEDALVRRDSDRGGRAFVRLVDVDALPTDWFGYESVDVLVLTTDDATLMHQLAGDEQRLTALRKWVELGGRLVVMCGGDATEDLFKEGGALAALMPGRFTEVVRLPDTTPIQHFAKSEVPIGPGGIRTTIMVPQIAEVEGLVEVYAGRRPGDLPLVVRTPRGFGEIAFVGIDLASPPLDEWVGRKAFLQAVLAPYLGRHDESAAGQSLVAQSYNDLSGALRQRLGRSFAGVSPISFSVVMIMAIAYLLALGPGDFLFVHRWLQRPRVAWISFPAVVLIFGLAAMAVSDRRQIRGGTRVNQLQVIDVDTITGQTRGTFWAALFSPRAEQFDVSLDVAIRETDSMDESKTLLSWWGLPGIGIGGMQSGGVGLEIVSDGYHYGEELESLINMPVLTSSTKSLMARWTGPAATVIDAQLVNDGGLAEGYIENRLDRPLHNVRLFYNGWAYRLGNLEPGRRLEISEEISPRRAKTVVTQDALGPVPAREDESNVFVAQRATAEQVLNLMMFYEAAGGFGFAQLANDYQSYCDLSRLLDLGRAIVVAEVPGGGSRLVDANGEALGAEQDMPTAVYRFVLPVAEQANER